MVKRKRCRKKSSHIEVILIICVLLIISLSIIIAWATLGKVETDVPDKNGPRDNAPVTDQILSSDIDSITGKDTASDTGTLSIVKLNVRSICQYPELPTGCEATATVMALNYLGACVYLEPFADLLPQQPVVDNGNGFQGPDPNVSFVGDPHKEIGSFGCFEQVIIKTVNDHYPAYYAQKVNGSIDDFCSYIDMGFPVLIWTTMELQEIMRVTTWTLPDGSSYTWPGREHCMLLVGYDGFYYYFNDPRNGECVAYEKDLSELRFEEMGSRAVVITLA